jgi:hypothetical protein
MPVFRDIKSVKRYWSMANQGALESVRKKINMLMFEAIEETLYSTQYPNPKYYKRTEQLYHAFKTELIPYTGPRSGDRVVGYYIRGTFDFTAIKPGIYTKSKRGRGVGKSYTEENRTRYYKFKRKELIEERKTARYQTRQDAWAQSPNYKKEKTITKDGRTLVGEAFSMNRTKNNFGIEYFDKERRDWGLRRKQYKGKMFGRLNPYADFYGRTGWKGRPLSFWVPYWLEFAKPWNGKQRYKMKDGKKIPIIGIRFRRTGFYTLFLRKMREAHLEDVYAKAMTTAGARVMRGDMSFGSWSRNRGGRGPTNTIIGREGF